MSTLTLKQHEATVIHLATGGKATAIFGNLGEYLAVLDDGNPSLYKAMGVTDGNREPWLAPVPLPSGLGRCLQFAFPLKPLRHQFALLGEDVVLCFSTRQCFKAPELVQRYASPEAAVVAYQHDGSWLASGGADGMLRVWNTDEGKGSRPLCRHISDAGIAALAFDGADGLLICDRQGRSFSLRHLISAGKLFDGSQVEVRELRAQDDESPGLPEEFDAYSCAFQPGGRLALFGGSDKVAYLIDCDQGEPIPLHGTVGSVIRRVEFLKVDALALYGDGVEIWHLTLRDDVPARRVFTWRPEEGRRVAALRAHLKLTYVVTVDLPAIAGDFRGEPL